MTCAPLLMGGACEKKPSKVDPGAAAALDHSEAAAGPLDTTPLQGVELKLEGDRAQLFYKLVGSLKSPCGKGESLRKSFTSDTSCKRAPFAVRWVASMLEDEAPEARVREDYAKKYEHPEIVKLDVSKAPRNGNDDAAIRIVEFFDYACPHCQAFKPVLDEISKRYEGKVVEYYLMYPLEGVRGHEQSKSAAQAALAASAQGKFNEMHELLFARAPVTDRASVIGYAKELGLDAAKFEAAYDAAAGQVGMDQQQGENAKVHQTPTVFINDHKYESLLMPRYLALWIDEELAVNR